MIAAAVSGYLNSFFIYQFFLYISLFIFYTTLPTILQFYIFTLALEYLNKDVELSPTIGGGCTEYGYL